MKLKTFIFLVLYLTIIVILAYFLIDGNYSPCSTRPPTKIEVDNTGIMVKAVMDRNQCHDQVIYNAIMKTFNPVLIAIMIGVESNYEPGTISPAGCRGLMQLSPDKLGDWTNPEKNIQAGTDYLQSLLIRFKRVDLALAAYNCGPGPVQECNAIPKIKETQDYIKRVKWHYEWLQDKLCVNPGGRYVAIN